MIEVNIGASVENRGRDIGRIESVVLDRENYEATHLVIKSGGPLHASRRLLPLGWVIASEHNRVSIDRAEAEVAALPAFELQHYVRLDRLDQEHTTHPRSKVKPADWINYFVPLVANAFGDPYHTPGVVVTDQLLASNESAIRRGLNVESSDGHKIGEVQEVLLSEPDWRLSGLVIGRGFVLTQPLRVPADWVARIERDLITLNRSKQQVEDWQPKE